MKKLKLKEVSEIYGGYAFKSKDFGVGENFVVKIKDIKPPIIDVENADKVDVSKYSTQKLEKFKVFPNDIVIAMTGATIGKVGRNKSGRTVFLNQRVAKINPNFKEDLDFIYYCVSNTVFLEYVLNNVDSKSAQANISHFGIGNFEINWYDRETRQKIAKVLLSLDDKIFINNQINQELEAMAKTLYDYWFVQFDFPDQNGKPYKSSGGKMVYIPELKREIPEGWGVEKIENIAQTGSGGTPKSTNVSYYSNGEIPWINSGELEQTVITSTSNFITEEGLNNSSAKLFPSGTILVAMYGATAGKVSFLTFEASTNQAICAIMLNDIRMRYYLKNVIEDLYQYLVKLSTGSARDNLSQDMIKNIKVVIPSNDILDRYYDFSNNIIKEITKKQQENEQLTQLRNWLLPMLMNGQVII